MNNGKISDNEYIVYAGSEKGLSSLSKNEIGKYCIKASRNYYLRPTFLLNLLKKSLQNDDLGFLQSYISLYLPILKVFSK